MLPHRPGLLLVLALVAGPAWADQGARPAASLRDLRDHFAGCFTPPSAAANTRVTFYFSMNARGGLVGGPRTTWLGFTGAPQDRAKAIGRFTQAFDGCLPVALDRRMAATLPGEVYFLQYVVGRDGHEDAVLLRPFGSHGGIGPRTIEPRGIEPREIEPPRLGRLAPVPTPAPMHGPVFDSPIALPPPRR